MTRKKSNRKNNNICRNNDNVFPGKKCNNPDCKFDEIHSKNFHSITGEIYHYHVKALEKSKVSLTEQQREGYIIISCNRLFFKNQSPLIECEIHPPKYHWIEKPSCNESNEYSKTGCPNYIVVECLILFNQNYSASLRGLMYNLKKCINVPLTCKYGHISQFYCSKYENITQCAPSFSDSLETCLICYALKPFLTMFIHFRNTRSKECVSRLTEESREIPVLPTELWHLIYSFVIGKNLQKSYR